MKYIPFFALLIIISHCTILSNTLVENIANHTDIAKRLIHEITVVDKGNAFNKLSEFVDRFGSRLCGSDSLEQAIDNLVYQWKQEMFENVRTEDVLVPHWTRGDQDYLEMIYPRKQRLGMLSLGTSIGTDKNGISAEIIVVTSWDDLERQKELVKGRIVVYNIPWKSYGYASDYRTNGASRASKYGAVAALVRSATPYSLYTLHTGLQIYNESFPKIPVAAITVEDAEMLHRMQQRGIKVQLKLVMNCKNYEPVKSRNVIAELKGSKWPNEIIVISGHIDSWDVGYGVQDDAGGVFQAYQALRAMVRLKLRPKRTIRLIAWTSEEYGGQGGQQYAKDFEHELKDHVLAFESDMGTFKPTGFGFVGSPKAKAIIQEIAKLLEPLGATTIVDGGGGVDISPIMKSGVPGMDIRTKNEDYFRYHHSPADTITALNSTDLDECAAAIAVMSYVVADLPERLPRSNNGI